MGNQPGKPSVYKQYYEALKYGKVASEPPPLSVDALTQADPYEVLGVSKNFTWEELKTHYRRMASLVHPDKGGTDQLFQLITQCFRQLANEYKARQADVSHAERKKTSERFYEERVATRPVAPVATSSKTEESFHERFNRVFDENRIEEEDQRGYGHLMTPSSKNREDIQVQRTLKKFTAEAFNDAFNELPSKETQVVKYKEPESLVLTKNIAYTELGGQTADFTHYDPTAKTGLFYTDYQEAYHEHNQRLIDPNRVQRKEFKSVKDYDAYRTRKSSRPISEREQAYLEEQKALEERREQERLERLRIQDEMYKAQHDKLSRLMLR